MEFHLFALRERKKCISGPADFGAVARRGHGIHIRPKSTKCHERQREIRAAFTLS